MPVVKISHSRCLAVFVFHTVFLGLAVAWVWAVIWNTPPLIFWDGYEPEGFGTSCAPNWFVKEPGCV